MFWDDYIVENAKFKFGAKLAKSGFFVAKTLIIAI